MVDEGTKTDWRAKTTGERAWFAKHCLPRIKGRPPTLREIAGPHKLDQSQLSRFIRDQLQRPGWDLAQRFAGALQVDVNWLMRGVGEPPVPTGAVPPRDPYGSAAPRQPPIVQHPNLAKAMEALDGSVSVRAMEMARRMAVTTGDMTAERWEAIPHRPRGGDDGARIGGPTAAP